MPVHGETIMQVQHSKTAIATGVSKKNIFIKSNGGRLMVKDGIVTSASSVPAEDVYVDETSLSGQSHKVIADRNKMAKNGVVVVTVGINSLKNEIIVKPEVETKGTTSVQKNGELFNAISSKIEQELIAYYKSGAKVSFANIKEIIRLTTEEKIFEAKKITPIVIPVVLNYNKTEK
jgi:ribonuclease J